MLFPRDRELSQLLAREGNGRVKIVTGMRRAGKSYLLYRIFRDHLLSHGVPADHVIEIHLDDFAQRYLRDAATCYAYIRAAAQGEGRFYVLLDEVQLMDDFVDVVNGLIRQENLDVYVTGSNSRFLSSDVITEFRGRGDRIHVEPLTFAQFAAAPGRRADLRAAWRDYSMYGGLPQVAAMDDTADPTMRSTFLTDLMEEVYLRDVVERHNLRGDAQIGRLVDVLASATGSLTNPERLARTFRSAGAGASGATITASTVTAYLSYLEDSFLLRPAQRWDVKGRKYITTPLKYYFADVGLRNARLRFRQQEENHVMENVLYNELCARGYQVDVGMVPVTRTVDGRRRAVQLEIDFIARRGADQVYIQSAWAMYDAAKRDQEERPLRAVDDSFRKVIVTREDMPPSVDDHGVHTVGLFDFLLDSSLLE